MGSAEASASLAAALPAAGGERTPLDVTALLVDLGRLLKARQFYPDRHPLLRESFERGYRAFEAEIRRGGPLALEVRHGGFRLESEPVGRGRVDDLAQELVKRAVRRLHFDGELTPGALERFIAILATEPEKLEQSGGFEKALYSEPCSGIRINEMDYAAALAQAGVPRKTAEEDSEAGADALAAGGALAVGVAGLQDGGADDLSAGEDGDAVAAALAQLGGGEKDEALLPAQRLEQAPLDALYEDDRAGALVTLLRELDAASDEIRYHELAREAAVRGAALSDDGLEGEGYRAILVLAAHGADAARSETVRTTALECLRELARGARLDALVDHACAPGEGVSLRAAQILLQLGATAAPALLRRVEAEQDLDRRGQLFGILIAMGDATTADLCAAMQSGERRRAGLAVRLAGEMQNAGTVGDLATLLTHEDLDLRREAAKALVRVGSPEAIEALVAALRSPQEGMPGHAAFCLGVAGGTRALEVLLATARREGGAETLDLAREAVRALGRMGRPEAVPVLAKLLERRSLLRRRSVRELQLAVVSALAKLPGAPARAALEQATRRGDAGVKEAARQALARVGSAPAEAASTRSAGA